MRKMINTASEVVEDLITGLVTRNAVVTRVVDWPVVVRRDRPSTTALISGGGSGHEPAHAGFVGEGMLDAAVCGPVFTSPPVDAVQAALEAVGPDREVLLIVKNYTGDRLNFGLAAEQARAQGGKVEQIVIADDVALGDSAGAGRRGIAGTVLVHKIAGAMAAQGARAQEIKVALESFSAGMGSMGVALGPALVPGATEPNFELAEDEVEWGLGIHGEPGKQRGSAHSAQHVAESLVETVVADRGLEAGEDVVVLVNGLGSTPPMELEILAGEVLAAVTARGLRPRLCWVGNLLTSLDMAGASLTLARVTEAQVEMLGAPTAAPGWVTPTVPADGAVPARGKHPAPVTVSLPDPLETLGQGRSATAVMDAMDRAVAAVLEAEGQLAELDRAVGDGDLGTNLARGARALAAQRDRLAAAPDLRAWFHAVAHVLRQEVGGTSGPLYSLLALAVGEAFEEGAIEPDPRSLARGLRSAVAQLQELGGARRGDGTMLDALIPAAQAAEAAGPEADPVAVGAAVAKAAADGAEDTTDRRAALGRSSYVGDRAIGVPDPGAVALSIWLAAALGQEAPVRRDG